MINNHEGLKSHTKGEHKKTTVCHTPGGSAVHQAAGFPPIRRAEAGSAGVGGFAGLHNKKTRLPRGAYTQGREQGQGSAFDDMKDGSTKGSDAGYSAIRL